MTRRTAPASASRSFPRSSRCSSSPSESWLTVRGAPRTTGSSRLPVSERALIIVPTYNERENIARLIDTVLSQDQRLEILVVDDGSPDGTADVVKGVMQRNPRVHILERPRKMGLGTAYLAGFRWALEQKV